MSLPKTIGSKRLAEFLRQQRAKLGMSQEEIALALKQSGYDKVSEPSVGRWERTGVVPALKDPANARIFARVYRTTPSQLLSHTGYFEVVPLGELDATLRKIPPELMNLLDQADPDTIKLITRVVRAILAEEK